MKLLHRSASSLICRLVNLLWKEYKLINPLLCFLSIDMIRYILLKIRIV